MTIGEGAARLIELLLLRGGHNTTVVMIGVALLGCAAGAIGCFALLRKRAMMGDVLSHATLPGLCVAFIAAPLLGFSGRFTPLLLAGAALSAAAGAVVVHLLARRTRLPEDACMGAVLSVFFGIGAVLLSYIQGLGRGSEAGLSHFILGQTAAMSPADAFAIGAVAVGVFAAIALLAKEFRIVCFDPHFGAAQGWPVWVIDLMLMSLVVLVVIVGLQAVGLILIIALLIAPAAAARLWTERLATMIMAAAAIGGASAYVGAALSAILPRTPTGGLIVLVAGAVFLFSLFFAPRRGVVAGLVRRRRRAPMAAEGAR
jgi:manganese/zinc/iron transport system permease protein